MGIWPLARLNIYKVEFECIEKSTWSFLWGSTFLFPNWTISSPVLAKRYPSNQPPPYHDTNNTKDTENTTTWPAGNNVTPLWNSSDTKVKTAVKYFKVLFSIKASDFLDGFHITRSPESIQAWCGKRWTMVVRILAALQRQALPFTASVWRTPSQPPTSASILYRSKHSN